MSVSKYLATVLVGCSLFQVSANAEAWANDRKITSIYPHPAGLTFMLDGARVNIGSPCESSRMVLPSATPNYDTILSSLLLAFASGFTVAINYDDSNLTLCELPINRAVITK